MAINEVDSAIINEEDNYDQETNNNFDEKTMMNNSPIIHEEAKEPPLICIDSE